MRKIPSMDTLLPKLPLTDAPNVVAPCIGRYTWARTERNLFFLVNRPESRSSLGMRAELTRIQRFFPIILPFPSIYVAAGQNAVPLILLAT